ncbi:uncharacterized protein PHALS_00916 [Plasmopara halstedii]|uniref:Uncharacterized protein n=1 Tax=Plasmopara halstedii TaxID=4781 RepID=A0A0P1ATN9_PLAHL|nr:uncharacterized protein PHALS_00916 [Plasmopara halstedii]CEG44565.1 hypothetical protein PHALS_00916 [Plasmopara halstedii]|eukprot:XP_024580934.1 hypothetical protein PHALS_00916 [Plasmopara halstedii]
MGALALLTTVETTKVKDAVSTNVTFVPVQHMNTHTPLKTDIDSKSIEERVLPNVEIIREHSQPFAGEVMTKAVRDILHREEYLRMPISDAIDRFIRTIKDKNKLLRNGLLLDWFKIQSPEDQKVATTLLAAKMKESEHTKSIVQAIFKVGKLSDDSFRKLTIAVERKLWISISQKDMIRALKLPPCRINNEDYVRTVGSAIWEKFGCLGDEEFKIFMLTRMRERSKDEIMWARIIYQLKNDQTLKFSLSGVFNDLLRTYDIAAGSCTPFDAVNLLTNFHTANSGPTVKVGNDFVRDVLQQRSNDELMWARVIYVLHEDERTFEFYSSAFDYLLWPYKAVTDQYTPSSIVKLLTDPGMYALCKNPLVDIYDWDKFLLEVGNVICKDKLVLSKLLFMLRNDENVSTMTAGLLNHILDLWINELRTIGESHNYNTNSLDSREMILKSPTFTDLTMYARFISNNPDVFVLEKLQEIWINEFEWGNALYVVNHENPIIASGVFDALLHSWIAKPYNSAAAANSDRILIQAYDFMVESLSLLQSQLPTSSIAQMIISKLLSLSNNEYIWAKYMCKLKEDPSFTTLAVSVFDNLLRKTEHIEDDTNYTPSYQLQFLTGLFSLKAINDMRLTKKPTVYSKMLKELGDMSQDEVTWAKLLYILQNSETNEEAKSWQKSVLEALLDRWMKPAGKATVEDETFLESNKFKNMIAYAKFSSDSPSVFLLGKLRERTADDVMWAQLLQMLWNKSDDLNGVFSALMLSWIGRPVHATTDIEEGLILCEIYNYLRSVGIASTSTSGSHVIGNSVDAMVKKLLTHSPDKNMWLTVLEQLKFDQSVDTAVKNLRDALDSY